MLKRWKDPVRRTKQPNNPETAGQENTPALKQMRSRVAMQAGLAILTVVLTVVLVFGMTAAWYTNVVHTGSLIFEVEEWGIDVNAQVYTTAVSAAPGDQGIIGFQVNNPSDSIVTVTVSTGKDGMEAEMSRRLYFYVDDQHTSNGETVQRVYLNSKSKYNYMLFGSGKLSLTDSYHNDVQLKWHWVYDVLGYYVLAQMDDSGTVTVEEYLQPIEYSYDEATFHEDGALETVDGSVTAEEFIVQLSEKDGYAGVVDPAAGINGYYPVEVDENGYGVYAYLCTYDEIRAEMDYDTQLGNAAAAGNPATYTAQFTVYAEKLAQEAVTVQSAEALAAALEGSAGLVQLGTDVVLEQDQVLELTADTQAILDLNGHTLTTNTASAAINVPVGSSLTVSGGTLTGAEGSGNAFAVSGADVVLSDVTLSGYEMGLRVTDNTSGGMDSTVRLIGCDFNTNDSAVLVYGNGSASTQTSKIIIDSCKLVSEDIVICGNGTATGEGRWGTDIQIINSEIYSNPANPLGGIYHPQKEGVLNIVGSTITGYNGVAIKGGTVYITDSTVIGAAETGMEEPGSAVSGYSSTGDGVYIETSYGYDIYLEINGNSVLTSYYAYGLRVHEEDADWVTVVKNGGTYQDKTKGSAG